MSTPRICVPIFPGSNGEIDNVRVLKRCGMDAFLFRWNDSHEKLADCDGYFFGAGFSYEDRGRSGMVAARDPLFQFLHEEAARGKVLIGNCNGAQMLVESGLIPLGDGLRLSLAHNAIQTADGVHATGFLNEWVWITPTCKPDRCATAHWTGPMHIPIAHGEGRFTTKDKDLLQELEKNDQIAFRYCDARGNVSEDPRMTPNGSTYAIAGICNPQGNVVALMPHPERTPLGDPYFQSVREWITAKKSHRGTLSMALPQPMSVNSRHAPATEIFIDTIITNNEERTVEAALRRLEPRVRLKQYRYLAPTVKTVEQICGTLSLYNPNKEVAYVRKNGKFSRWNATSKTLEETTHAVLCGTSVLRRDEPDTGALSLGKGSETGVCYDCRSIDDTFLSNRGLLEVLGNPHSSVLERMA